MDDVRLPIKTIKEGDKITKICVEDIYKVLNRVMDSLNRSYDKSIDIIDSVFKDYEDSEGELIIGTGVSQPCGGDVFDETIGNEIAFRKAKLNANIKKHALLVRIFKQWFKAFDQLDEELNKIDIFISKDLKGIRKYNPEYLSNLEEELGIKEIYEQL